MITKSIVRMICQRDCLKKQNINSSHQEVCKLNIVICCKYKLGDNGNNFQLTNNFVFAGKILFESVLRKNVNVMDSFLTILT